MTESTPRIIDVEKQFKTRLPGIYHKLPRSFLRLIRHIVYENRLNHLIHESRDLEGIELVNWALEQFQVTVKIKGQKNIPADGRNIFVANHPIGGLDSLALLSALGSCYTSLKILSNEILDVVAGFHPLRVSVVTFGKFSRANALALKDVLISDQPLCVFPAGFVAKRNPVKIQDLPWNKFFVTSAVKYRRQVVPVFIAARNSALFYNIASIRRLLHIKSNLEMFLLPHEMFNKAGSTITIMFGAPISFATFDRSRTHREWAQQVRELVYLMGEYDKKDSWPLPKLENVI